MRIHKEMIVILSAAVLLSAAVTLLPTAAMAGPQGLIRLAAADGGDGGGHAVNLTLQQVTIYPVRAYIGDPIYVNVVVDNREDGSDTSWVELYANKKKVAQQMFRWGSPGSDRSYKVGLTWDTSGMTPGEYKVKAEVFVFDDVSPFDNELTLAQPVILVAPGGQFPEGASAGGSVTEIDPRYK